MEYIKECHKDVLVFSFEGEYSAGGRAADFLSEIEVELRAGSLRYVFDFGRVSYINSSGIQILAKAGKKIGAFEGFIALIHVPPFAHKILTQLGLFSHFPVISSLDEAVGEREPA